jgi:hypothetical protein
MTPWVIASEKLIVSQLVNKYTAFYGTPYFITTFTKTRHLFLSGVGSI